MKQGGEIMLAIRQREITDSIIKNGFSLDDFEFKPISNDEFSIYYKPNKIFSLRQSAKKTQGIKKMNVYTMIPFVKGVYKETFDFEGFDVLKEKLEIWLNALRENVEIGNPWDIFGNNTEFSQDINFDSYEEVFTEEEEKVIHLKLDLLLGKIKKLELETSSISEDINHLKEMTNKISKKDWILLFVGMMSSWGLQTLAPSEVLDSIVGWTKELFSSFKFLLKS